MALQIYNTLSRSIEEFAPQNPPEVTMYACGPTVYLPQHLGNLRPYICWDIVRRTLEVNGYRVRLVINVTDVGHMTSNEDAGEDKIEQTARAQGKSPLEVANLYLAMFQRDLKMVGVREPDRWCRATDHIPEMQALIARIIEKGFAYVTPSGVYFDVEKWRGPSRMGKLSRQSLDAQQSGNRLEHSADKKSPHDFALWVTAHPSHIQQWDSPWGRGYPGWHIECSAMSMKYLGETLDIHAGGMDHIPIHHENEIEQSESATGLPFVRYFLHNAFVVNKEGAKISKSAGKFPLLSDLTAQGFAPLAYRMFCFGAKYRSEIMLNDESIRAAQSTLDYFHEFARNVPADAPATAPEWAREHVARFDDAMRDDLNTPRALAAARELIADAYKRKDFGAWSALLEMDRVLGIDLEHAHRASAGESFEPAVKTLIDERAAARRARDFKRADALRLEIESHGYDVKDARDGATVYKKRA